MKNLIVILALFLISACGSPDNRDNIFQEEAKTILPIANYSKEQINKKLQSNFLNKKALFDIRTYKIDYNTTDDLGNRVKASGIITIPTSTHYLSIVLDCHGTIFSNKYAPSNIAKTKPLSNLVAILYSAVGEFITLQPDYIGFGDSNSTYKPFLLKKSSEREVADFLDAAINFIKKHKLALLNDQIYLSGYSQGAYVALSALKELEKREYVIKITAAMSGPYILEPYGKALSKSKTIKAPSYAAAFVYSYAKVYKKSLNKIFNSKYIDQIPTLLDGNYTRVQIDNALPKETKELFKADFLKKYDYSWFRLKLLENSAFDLNYIPFSKIDLIHCKGDSVVPYKIASITKSILSFLGDQASIITPKNSEKLDHIGCIAPAYDIAFKAFINDRNKSFGY